ncbi:hypothetical protein ACOSP7_028550 [Xanthoceras sorbifolium]
METKISDVDSASAASTQVPTGLPRANNSVLGDETTAPEEGLTPLVLHENSVVYVFQAKEKEGTNVVINSRAQPQHGVETCPSSASSVRQSFVSQVLDYREKISTAEKGKAVAILDFVDASSRQPMDTMPAGPRSFWKRRARTSNDTRLVEMKDSWSLKRGASSEMEGPRGSVKAEAMRIFPGRLESHDIAMTPARDCAH